ncbi:MAG TPA: SigB/SigF/SigG family RNA polymerase sigma factor [Actinomycetota bacterium]|nr:SigB/SigF/SigG family RNA polymerase sigma factor [Actinomycetota bacterium]
MSREQEASTEPIQHAAPEARWPAGSSALEEAPSGDGVKAGTDDDAAPADDPDVQAALSDMSDLLDVDPVTLDERSRALFARMPDEQARNDLVALYHPLAEYLSSRFRGYGESSDDLGQVASIGLIKAIDRFDTERGVKFSTYATPTIVGELKRHFRDRCWAIRVPRRLQDLALQLRDVLSSLNQEIGRSPTIAEIAERAGLTTEQVLEGMETMQAYSASSLDTPAEAEFETSLIDTLADPDESIELVEGWADLGPLIRRLPERERKILYYRFFRGLSQSQIAEQLDISQMHVSRLLSRTLSMLRANLGDLDG